MFTAALFTKAKIWKKHRCLSMHEWIKKMWDIFSFLYYQVTWEIWFLCLNLSWHAFLVIFYFGLAHFGEALYRQRALSVQFSSVTQSCPTPCDPMNSSTPGLPVQHQLPESTQTHVHRVGDAIQPSHPLSSPSPSAPNPSQHHGLFQWVNSSHEVAKILEFQLQHQSFQ